MDLIRVYILQLLGGLSYKCQLEVVDSISISLTSLLIFIFLNINISERWLLKWLTMI